MKVKFPPSSHEDPEAVIPHGCYCYWHTGRRESSGGMRLTSQVCPFWANIPDAPPQMNGYCHYLKTGDMMDRGTMLIWDMVKECGINDDWDETDWMYGPHGEC